MRLYTLIVNKMASKMELESCYTLDEALKLYALFRMQTDIQRMDTERLRSAGGDHR